MRSTNESKEERRLISSIMGGYVLELRNYAKRYFKSSADKIILKAGWVLNDELYLEYPDNRRAKACYAAYLK